MKKNKLIAGTSLVASLLSISSLSSLAGCSCATTTTVHINSLCDVHGEIPGYGDDFFTVNKKNAGAIRTIQEIQKIQANCPGSITLSCGDQNGSGTFSTIAKGDTMYPVFSAMDVRYSAVGNHAWDFGKDKLLNKTFDTLGRTSKTEGNYFVTSNVLNDPDLQNHNWHYLETDPEFEHDYQIWANSTVKWADEYKIIDMNGHKVALIGLTTKGTLEDGAKSEIKNLSFIDYIPAIHFTKHKMVNDIGQEQFNKIDAFIGLTHVQVGYNSSGEVIGDAVDLCKNVDTKLDLVLSGHWHQDVAEKIHNDKLNKDIPVVQSCAHLESFCDSTLTFDNSKKEGERLKDIEVKIVKPEIAEDKAEANKQIQNIIDNPFDDVVKNTCKVYEEQKQIDKVKLDETFVKSNDGLKYDILDKKFSHEYGQTGIEQAGVFSSNANIQGFSQLYADRITSGELVKPSISIVPIDSVNQAIAAGDVKLKDVYGLQPFDNKPVSYSLTYYQLEQVIRYMLYRNYRVQPQLPEQDYYTEKLYYKEGVEVDPTKIGTIKYVSGPAQFGGFKFDVLQVTDTYGTKYEYKDDSLCIYDPYDASCDINNPDTFKGKSFWVGSTQKPIVGVMSNFSFNDGNQQLKMIKEFATWNDEGNIFGEGKYKTHWLDEDLRQLCVKYLEYLRDNSKTADISIETINKMFNGF